MAFPQSAADLTVHEWGTFTSVAGEDGAPISWVSLAAPSDLPCFVYRLDALCVKCSAIRTVRMETPVLYFYSPRPVTASVHVELPRGVITEWYPKASGAPADVTYGSGSRLDWGPIHVSPGTSPMFPHDGSDSHYYPARNTDAAPLEVSGQAEKLLFYRGIGDDGAILGGRMLPGGGVELRNTGSTAIPFAMVFENRDGRIGYRAVRDLRDRTAIDPIDVDGDASDVHRALGDALVEAGLFPKEAAAMIETWRDSWFEEGMRVFYILPRRDVDAAVPLKVSPSPTALARVFVGRLELLSPTTERKIRTALATSDTAVLSRCGRFLDPFLATLMRQGLVTISPASQAFLTASRTQLAGGRVPPCKQPPLAIPTQP
jgi:hypothetical protein